MFETSLANKILKISMNKRESPFHQTNQLCLFGELVYPWSKPAAVWS